MMSKSIRTTLAIILAAGSAASGARAAQVDADRPLIISKQGSFFVGGHDVQSDALSTIPNFASSGTISVDQVYVRYQTPVRPARYSITLIHGCCLSGKSWETTPDGRMGWDEYFLRQNFTVYVIDQAWRGRSAANPAAVNAVKAGKAGADTLPAFISAGHESAWTIFRFGPEYPKVFPGMQFPLEAQGEFWKQMVPDWGYSMKPPVPTVPALSELAQKVGNTVLISHSQSGIYPFQTAMISSKGIAAIISLEPGACPAADYDMSALKNIPVLVLFGDFVDKSEAWTNRFKGCQEFVRSAKAAGVTAELVSLPDVGFHGNSHMIMQDRNSLAVAGWLGEWLSHHVRQPSSRQ
ncbi:esterase [Bradyrhizobium brasilense]|uniref:Esterase n=1 Tax=Bradyrhizobium brasilense TaxID=1419277 RepID=A0ABY8JH36_9BRAD|nr:esterase [Bradyrhizobium brasilense]OMI10951.1 esterase [Bradyrhizobium brasilense]WFU64914.1 esterase [Bradyrhizobium brasilense]